MHAHTHTHAHKLLLPTIYALVAVVLCLASIALVAINQPVQTHFKCLLKDVQPQGKARSLCLVIRLKENKQMYMCMLNRVHPPTEREGERERVITSTKLYMSL